MCLVNLHNYKNIGIYLYQNISNINFTQIHILFTEHGSHYEKIRKRRKNKERKKERKKEKKRRKKKERKKEKKEKKEERKKERKKNIKRENKETPSVWQVQNWSTHRPHNNFILQL